MILVTGRACLVLSLAGKLPSCMERGDASTRSKGVLVMKRLLLALTAAILATAPAHAINRYNIDHRTCGVEVERSGASEHAASDDCDPDPCERTDLFGRHGLRRLSAWRRSMSRPR